MECNNCGNTFALNKNLKRSSDPTTEKSADKCPECGEDLEKSVGDKNSNLLEKGI